MPTNDINKSEKKVRAASLSRKTKETQISMALELDRKKGGFCGSTGIGFFDHMLNSFAVHGGFVINLDMEGDLEVDGHHSVEDVGIVLGKLFAEILGDRAGIAVRAVICADGRGACKGGNRHQRKALSRV